MKPALAVFLLPATLFAFLSSPRLSVAQAPTTAQPAAAEYPDSTGGLERLVKDIQKAQKENHPDQADALVKSLILPDYETWYRENFDDYIVRASLPSYRANVAVLPVQLAGFFLNMESEGRRVEAFRFDKNFDDDASDQMFPMLEGRLKKFPIYEVRFYKGAGFGRAYGFVYLNGGFRYILPPNFDPPPKPAAAGSTPATTAPKTARESDDGDAKGAEAVKRVTVGANVQAARLIDRVQPLYPTVAREEHLQGVVQMHAVIGKDGTVQQLRVRAGKCSLSRAAVDAVRKWKYQPTLLMGQPVEVDTEINVVFQLGR